MARSRKGVKGQIKEHKKHDGGSTLSIPAQGLGPMRANDGPLILHSCHNCMDDVLAPTKTKRVRCGRCTMLSVEKAREDGKL